MGTDETMMPRAGPGALRGIAARMFEKAMAQNLENVERLLVEAAPLEIAAGRRVRRRREHAALGSSGRGLGSARHRGRRRTCGTGGAAWRPGRAGRHHGRPALRGAAIRRGRLEPGDRARLRHRSLRGRDTPGAASRRARDRLHRESRKLAQHRLPGARLAAVLAQNVTGRRLGIGNPLALHRGQEPIAHSWQHQRVFGYRGLVELFEAHGFAVGSVLGAGYYPLPSRLARADRRHAAFLTVAARRPR